MNSKKKLCKVIENRKLTDNTYCLVLEKPDYKFLPGQCFNLGLKEFAVNREYSIYSSDMENYISFLIKKVDEGIVSNHLFNVKKGDEVEIDGPYGEFYLNNDHLKKPLFFICTGTGIAPFHSFIKSYKEINCQILHGIRYENEQYDKDVYSGNRYIPCISKHSDSKKAFRVTDYLKLNEINLESYFFLCGNSKMINEVNDILINRGVSQSQIFSEVFF